jgi:hypothetical protein
MRRLPTPFTIGLFFALGLAGPAVIAMAAPSSTAIASKSDNNVGHAIQDIGLLPALASSENSTPALASASTGSNAEPIPELPTWTMMLVFFMGLGLAVFKRGRKDRLSPGID